MISLYGLQEIFKSIRQHKVRNIITGFGIAWGIFILMLLLGAGNGVKKGISKMFSGYAKNSLWIYGGQSSVTNANSGEGREISFDDQLLSDLKSRFPEIRSISAELTFQQNAITSFGGNSTLVTLKGVQEGYFNIKPIKLAQGRIFDRFDINANRPTCIISKKIAKQLFKPGEDPIGNYILINDTWFNVVGVLAEGVTSGQDYYNSIFITFLRFQTSFNKKSTFSVFGVLLKDNSNSSRFGTELTAYLARRLSFDKNDSKSLFILNFNEQVKSFNKLFNGIDIALWGVGVCLLLSGIVCIGNMMLIIVQERTKEIGIRKAIGATPKSILKMIIAESIILTVLAGITGLLIGVGVIAMINQIFGPFFKENKSIIDTFEISLPVSLIALAILVISGVLAGLIPAKKAADIRPIAALNTEN